eukprot:18514-Heterococcus_DN1.PRE.1
MEEQALWTTRCAANLNLPICQILQGQLAATPEFEAAVKQQNSVDPSKRYVTVNARHVIRTLQRELGLRSKAFQHQLNSVSEAATTTTAVAVDANKDSHHDAASCKAAAAVHATNRKHHRVLPSAKIEKLRTERQTDIKHARPAAGIATVHFSKADQLAASRDPLLKLYVASAEAVAATYQRKVLIRRLGRDASPYQAA